MAAKIMNNSWFRKYQYIPSCKTLIWHSSGPPVNLKLLKHVIDTLERMSIKENTNLVYPISRKWLLKSVLLETDKLSVPSWILNKSEQNKCYRIWGKPEMGRQYMWAYLDEFEPWYCIKNYGDKVENTKWSAMKSPLIHNQHN